MECDSSDRLFDQSQPVSSKNPCLLRPNRFPLSGDPSYVSPAWLPGPFPQTHSVSSVLLDGQNPHLHFHLSLVAIVRTMFFLTGCLQSPEVFGLLAPKTARLLVRAVGQRRHRKSTKKAAAAVAVAVRSWQFTI